MALPLVRTLRERRDLRRARLLADRDLIRWPTAPARLAWRAAELTSDENRLTLAASLRGLLDRADVSHLPSASPLNRLVIRAQGAALLRLAAQLSDLEVPVAPRGVLLLEQFLTDGGGPLYDRERGEELGIVLVRLQHDLEVNR